MLSRYTEHDMINYKSVEAVKAARWPQKQGEFCRPLYDSYGFSKIPGTLQRLLGEAAEALPPDCWIEDRYESVVLFLIDGFGWEFLEKHQARFPFLSRFFKEGIVSQLTAQFPSTTAAHITTLCSGQEVGQTGIYEWFMYEPQLDSVIAPLLYSLAGDEKVGSLKKVIEPGKIFPRETIFQNLKEKGIPSRIYQAKAIANSVYSESMFQGGTMVPYRKFAGALASLLEDVQQGGLFYVYFGDIDTKAHQQGIDSKQVIKAIDECFHHLEAFWQEVVKIQKKVACLVTADHGMRPIKTMTYLNREIPELESLIRIGKDGKLLTPAGSCQDYFLHIIPEKLSGAKRRLESSLDQKALVCETKALIQEGFFGTKQVSKAFENRVGNLVILPYENHSVWWDDPRYEKKFCAMHGGLTPQEMETIFLFNRNR